MKRNKINAISLVMILFMVTAFAFGISSPNSYAGALDYETTTEFRISTKEEFIGILENNRDKDFVGKSIIFTSGIDISEQLITPYNNFFGNIQVDIISDVPHKTVFLTRGMDNLDGKFLFPNATFRDGDEINLVHNTKIVYINTQSDFEKVFEGVIKPDKTIILNTDIYISDNFRGLTSFAGKLLGQNHKIIGLNKHFFGSMLETARVQDVSFLDVNTSEYDTILPYITSKNDSASGLASTQTYVFKNVVAFGYANGKKQFYKNSGDNPYESTDAGFEKPLDIIENVVTLEDILQNYVNDKLSATLNNSVNFFNLKLDAVVELSNPKNYLVFNDNKNIVKYTYLDANIKSKEVVINEKLELRGIGTEKEPYIIANSEELLTFLKVERYFGKFGRLTDNIHLDGANTANYVLKNNLLGNGYAITGGYGRLLAEISQNTSISNLIVGYFGVASNPTLIGVNNGTIDNLNVYGITEDVEGSAIIGTNNSLILGLVNFVATKYMIIENSYNVQKLSNMTKNSSLVKTNSMLISKSVSYEYENINNLVTCVKNGEIPEFLGSNSMLEDILKSFYVKSGIEDDIYYVSNIKNYDIAKEDSYINLPLIGDIVFESTKNQNTVEGAETSIGSSTISVAILKANYFDTIDFFGDKELSLQLFEVDGDVRREVIGEINQIGRYSLAVNMPSGLTYTKISTEYNFQIILGTVTFVPNPILDDLDYNGFDRDEYVKETIKNSIYFNIFGEGSIDLVDYQTLFDGWVFVYQIIWSGGHANSIKNAGRYDIKISATKYGMETQTLQTEITINKVNIKLSPSALNINYGLPLAASIVVDGGLLGNDTLDSAIKVSNIKFDTNYEQYSPPGTYNVRLKEKEVGLSSTNYNVVLEEGKYVTFTVAKLSIIAKELSDRIVDYNGEAQGLTPYSDQDIVELIEKYSSTLKVSYTYDNKVVDSGEYTITVVLSAEHYYSQTYTKKLVINKIDAQYIANSYSIKYLEESPKFDGNLVGVLDIDSDKELINGALVFSCEYTRGRDAGRYEIVPSGITTTNYKVSFVNAVLTVDKIATSCTLSNYSKSYDGSPYKPILTLSEVNIKYWKADDTLMKYTEIINAGQYIMEVTKPETTNYLSFEKAYEIGINSVELDVAYEDSYKAEYNAKYVDISFGALPSDYKLDITYQITKNALPTNIIISEIKDIGIYSIKATIMDSLGNYNTKNLETTLTITPIYIDIADIGDVEFNGEIIIPNITSNSPIPEEDNLTFGYIEKDGLEIKNAQKYSLKITVSNSNYEINHSYKEFNILPLSVEVDLATLEPLELEYGEKLERDFSHSFWLGNKEIVEELIGFSNVTNPDVGSYDLVGLRPKEKSSNYVFSVKNAAKKFIVNPREIDFVSNGEKAVPYKGEVYEETFFASDITNVIDGDIVNISFVPESQLMNAKEYKIIATSNNKNYKLKQNEFTFEITKKEVTLVVNEKEIVFNDPLPTRFGITIDGLVGGESLDVFSNLVFGSNYTLGANVGEYEVELKEYLAENYLVIEITKGKLIVTPKDIDWVSVADIEYVYDGNPKGFSIQGDTTNMIITYSRPTDVGEYSIDVSLQLTNHNEKTLSAKIKINKASPTLVVSNLRLKYNTDTKLDGKIVNGSAKLKDKEIAGNFTFLTPTLLYGENEYIVVFLPDDNRNINTEQAKICIDATVEKEDFEFIFNSSVYVDENNIIEHNDDIVMIFKNHLGNNAKLRYFLNGIELSSAYYIFNETMTDAIIQYKIGEEIVYQEVFHIYIDREPISPDEPSKELPTIKEKPNLTWLYITIGVAVVIVIAGVVIVLRSKK